MAPKKKKSVAGKLRRTASKLMGGGDKSDNNAKATGDIDDTAGENDKGEREGDGEEGKKTAPGKEEGQDEASSTDGNLETSMTSNSRSEVKKGAVGAAGEAAVSEGANSKISSDSKAEQEAGGDGAADDEKGKGDETIVDDQQGDDQNAGKKQKRRSVAGTLKRTASKLLGRNSISKSGSFISKSADNSDVDRDLGVDIVPDATAMDTAACIDLAADADGTDKINNNNNNNNNNNYNNECDSSQRDIIVLKDTPVGDLPQTIAADAENDVATKSGTEIPPDLAVEACSSTVVEASDTALSSSSMVCEPSTSPPTQVGPEVSLDGAITTTSTTTTAAALASTDTETVMGLERGSGSLLLRPAEIETAAPPGTLLEGESQTQSVTNPSPQQSTSPSTNPSSNASPRHHLSVPTEMEIEGNPPIAAISGAVGERDNEDSADSDAAAATATAAKEVEREASRGVQLGDQLPAPLPILKQVIPAPSVPDAFGTLSAALSACAPFELSTLKSVVADAVFAQITASNTCSDKSAGEQAESDGRIPEAQYGKIRANPLMFEFYVIFLHSFSTAVEACSFLSTTSAVITSAAAAHASNGAIKIELEVSVLDTLLSSFPSGAAPGVLLVFSLAERLVGLPSDAERAAAIMKVCHHFPLDSESHREKTYATIESLARGLTLMMGDVLTETPGAVPDGPLDVADAQLLSPCTDFNSLVLEHAEKLSIWVRGAESWTPVQSSAAACADLFLSSFLTKEGTSTEGETDGGPFSLESMPGLLNYVTGISEEFIKATLSAAVPVLVPFTVIPPSLDSSA